MGVFTEVWIPMVDPTDRFYGCGFIFTFGVKVQLYNRIETKLIDNSDPILTDKMNSATQSPDCILFY